MPIDTSTRTAQAQVDSAQVALQQAQRTLDQASIYAPYDSVISQMNFNLHDIASGTALNIVDLTQLQVKVTIAEVDVANIKVGETAQMTADALSGLTYNAKVLAVAPAGTVMQGVVNFPVTVAILNNDGQVLPGMTANLAITVSEQDNVLLLPLRAVHTTGNQKTVTILSQGTNVSVPVTTRMTNDTSVEIKSGVKEGDSVVLNQTTTRPASGGGGLSIPGLRPVLRGGD